VPLDVEFRHAIIAIEINTLIDLRTMPRYINQTIYRGNE